MTASTQEIFTRLYGRKRLNDRTIDELIGLSKGIIADNVVNQQEAEFLMNWMVNNTQFSDDIIISTLFNRLKNMLKDGILDEEEQAELLQTLVKITGEQLQTNKAITTPTSFPLDDPPPEIKFEDYTFCFTGTFAFGPRKVCHELTVDRGGMIKKTVSATVDYLVIGNLCSPAWAHTSFGRKIETAVKLNNEKTPVRGVIPNIKIIHEDHWIQSVQQVG